MSGNVNCNVTTGGFIIVLEEALNYEVKILITYIQCREVLYQR